MLSTNRPTLLVPRNSVIYIATGRIFRRVAENTVPLPADVQRVRRVHETRDSESRFVHFAFVTVGDQRNAVEVASKNGRKPTNVSSRSGARR